METSTLNLKDGAKTINIELKITEKPWYHRIVQRERVVFGAKLLGNAKFILAFYIKLHKYGPSTSLLI